MKKRTLVIIVAVVGVITYLGYAHMKNYVPAYTKTSEELKRVTIPIEDKFLDLYITADNELVYTNDYNKWEYNNITILTSKAPVSKTIANSEGIFVTKNSICKKFSNTYVTILSDKGLLENELQSLKTVELMSLNTTLDKNFRIGTLPYAEDIVDFEIKNKAYIAKQSNKSMIVKEASTSYNTTDGYYRVLDSYVTYQEAIEYYSKRLIVANQDAITEWYKEDGVFYAKSGDRYLGIRTINKSEQIVIIAKGKEGYNFMIASLKIKE